MESRNEASVLFGGRFGWGEDWQNRSSGSQVFSGVFFFFSGVIFISPILVSTQI